MATNYPTNLDNLNNPTAGDLIIGGMADLYTQLANLNDAVEALQSKVGKDSSAVPTSLDYKTAVSLPAAITSVADNLTALNSTVTALSATVNGLVIPPNEASVQGIKAWNFDPFNFAASSQPVSGTLQVQRIALPTTTISTLYVIDGLNSGSGITQARAALYTAAGALLSGSANQLSGWNSGAMIPFTLDTPQAVTAGVYYIGFWITATTTPGVARGGGAYANVNLSAANSRSATTNNTGLTTTAPSTLGTKTATTAAYWVGAN